MWICVCVQKCRSGTREVSCVTHAVVWASVDLPMGLHKVTCIMQWSHTCDVSTLELYTALLLVSPIVRQFSPSMVSVQY